MLQNEEGKNEETLNLQYVKNENDKEKYCMIKEAKNLFYPSDGR